MVNQWATILAAWWLSVHRANPAPGSLNQLRKDAIADMKLVHDGDYDLPGIGERTAAFPSWSNVRVDMLANVRKVRVERPLSDRTPVPYRQNVDWPADIVVDP